jgi:hypothetical protein
MNANIKFGFAIKKFEGRRIKFYLSISILWVEQDLAPAPAFTGVVVKTSSGLSLSLS